jgi:arylsulfatase A-like enzyme
MMGSPKNHSEKKVEKIHLDDETISAEMFGNRAVFMGDWKARNNIFPLGDGQWKLFNIKKDIKEATDLSKEHPEILEKMVSEYDKYAQNVGIIPPKYSEQQKQGVIQMLLASNQTEFTGLPLEKYLAGYPAEG